MSDIKQILLDKMPMQVACLLEKGAPLKWYRKSQAIKYERIKLYGSERHLLMIDYDAQDNGYRAMSHTVYELEPNFIIHNKLNHQAGWLMTDPVYSQSSVRNNHPYRYLKAVERCFDDTYAGDKHFGRYISRNPFFDETKTTWLHDKSFTLKELADSVDLNWWNECENDEYDAIQTISGARELDSESTKYGRDSDIFDNLRFWAYKQDKKNLTYSEWVTACSNMAIMLNNYKNPLPKRKVLAVAKSVAQYTYHRLHTHNGTFEEYVTRSHTSDIQATRGSKGGKISKGGGRKPLDEKLIAEIRALKNTHNYSNKAIARELKIAPKTVRNYA
jgi:hypothetical protein